MFTTSNASKMATCLESKTETGGGSAKHVQSKQQKHQNDVIDMVVISLSPTLTISHTLPLCPHFRLRESKRPLGHNN